MPKVGMKSFSYDQSGMDKANEEARRTGLPVEYEDRNYAQYNAGGRVFSKGVKGLAKVAKKATSKKPETSEKAKSLTKKKMYGHGGSVEGGHKAKK
jgi:hypothetical protein